MAKCRLMTAGDACPDSVLVARRIMLAVWLVLAPAPCRGEAAWHTRSLVYGCTDPRATRLINGEAAPRVAPVWIGSARRDGQCFKVTPEQHWEAISLRDGLRLLRRTPPMPGEPPLFFRPRDLAPVARLLSKGAAVPDDRP
jgi:restriction system protein